MTKFKLIMMAVKFLMGAIALGIGIWYLDSSIGGASLTYSSTRNFMTAIGAADGDIANVNGCFLCKYIQELFGIFGNAIEDFWTLMINHLWILMAVGFGLFLVLYSGKYIYDAMTQTAKLDDSAKKLELKAWFDKVWRQGARVMFAGVLIGALGMGGTGALRTITNITVTPVLFIGSQLSVAAVGAIDGGSCQTTLADNTKNEDILNPVMQPFSCVMGAINTVMLAGAAGGFALMNYSWLGLGGGVFTWLAGLALVIMFLIIGFDLVFDILSVLFKVIFVIIFAPIFIAAAAFEPVWARAKGLLNNAITNFLVKPAVKIIAIALQTIIMFAVVSFAADSYFPGPNDGYSAIFPPLLGQAKNTDAQTMSVRMAFEECESVSLVDGTVDKDKFKSCFESKKSEIEAIYPGAFDFMDDGFGFIMLMIGIFFLYFMILKPKIKQILGLGNAEEFDFGGWVKNFGKTVWKAPETIAGAVTNASEKISNFKKKENI